MIDRSTVLCCGLQKTKLSGNPQNQLWSLTTSPTSTAVVVGVTYTYLWREGSKLVAHNLWSIATIRHLMLRWVHGVQPAWDKKKDRQRRGLFVQRQPPGTGYAEERQVTMVADGDPGGG